MILTLTGIREKIINAIPFSIRISVGAGIGLFITSIGMKNIGLIVDNTATLVSMGKFTKPLIIGLTGLAFTSVLLVKKVRGALFWGIIFSYVLGVVFGEVEIGFPFSLPPSPSAIAFKLNIYGALKLSFWGAIFSFMFVDLFDSVETIIACSYQAGMVDENGKMEKIDKMLEADAVATVVGAVMGTSTTTTYIESASGIADGARSGLSSLVVSLLFLLIPFFAPFIGSVPSFATAPALIVVGVFMFRSIKDIDFHDFEVAIPAFLTIVSMPLTYSISNGVSIGFISYGIITIFCGDYKKTSITLWVIILFSVLNLLMR